MQYYFTVGPRYFFLHQHNDSSYVKRNIERNGLGVFVNTGFAFIVDHFLIDVFGEYSYEKLHFRSFKGNVQGRSLQVGGLSFGAGLGYSF